MSERIPLVAKILGPALAVPITAIGESIFLAPVPLSSGKVIHPHPDVQGWIVLGLLGLAVFVASTIIFMEIVASACNDT